MPFAYPPCVNRVRKIHSMYMCMLTHTRTHAHTHTHTHILTHTYLQTHTHTETHRNTQIHTSAPSVAAHKPRQTPSLFREGSTKTSAQQIHTHAHTHTYRHTHTHTR